MIHFFEIKFFWTIILDANNPVFCQQLRTKIRSKVNMFQIQKLKCTRRLNGVRPIKRWLRLTGHFCFINKTVKHFRFYQNSLNIFFVCYQHRLLKRDFSEAVVESLPLIVIHLHQKRLNISLKLKIIESHNQLIKCLFRIFQNFFYKSKLNSFYCLTIFQ